MKYMTHPRHGATHAEDSDVERLQKAGWVLAKEPTAAEILAAKRSVMAGRLRAELAQLEDPVQPPPVKAKRKYERKASA